MKRSIFIVVILLGVFAPINSSAQLLKKLKDKVEKKAEEKLLSKKETKVEVEDETADQGGNEESDETKSTKEGTSYNSKFDFVPGEKLIVYDDFSQDAVGDFPGLWFTNGSGEVVTIDGFEGKWLMLKDNSKYFMDKLLTLPENYTIQFDLMCSMPFEWGSSQLYFRLKDVIDIDRYREGRNGGEMTDSNFRNDHFTIDFHPGLDNGSTKAYGHYTGFNQKGNLSYEQNFIPVKGKNLIKVSLWRQKERLRMYVNENKMLDLPKIFPADLRTTVMTWEVNTLNESNYFIGNIRIAAGNPDTRNKLLTEGKLVTNGIHFAVNSDQIKSESYGVLKEIAGVLKESSAVKVMIVGHTDSDGDEAGNLELSKKRAAAVKKVLASDFGVEADRMEIDGKGESMPEVANSDAISKAKNRRVEFIKTN